MFIFFQDSCVNKNIELSEIMGSLKELLENQTMDGILMDLMKYGIPDGEDWETQIYGIVGKMWMSSLKFPEDLKHLEIYSNKSIGKNFAFKKLDLNTTSLNLFHIYLHICLD